MICDRADRSPLSRDNSYRLSCRRLVAPAHRPRRRPPRRRWLPWARPPRAGGRRCRRLSPARAPTSPSAARRRSRSRAPRRWSRRRGGSTALPVLVATGYVVARRSSDVGVKTGGRLARAQVRRRDPRAQGRGHRARSSTRISTRSSRRRAAPVAEAEAQLGAGDRGARRGCAQPRTAARAGEGRHHDRPRR